MTSIDPRIFRAYDIRGKAHSQLTEEACFLIGRAFGDVLCERYGASESKPRVVLGRDARTHGPALEEQVSRGLVSAGCTVLQIGQTPSPVNYFTVCKNGYEGGVQITASHNPKEDNGIKLCTRDADAFSGEDLQELYRRVTSHKSQVISTVGSMKTLDAITPYIQAVTKLFTGVGEELKIAVDSGNGVAGPVYCEILRRVGCAVTELYTEPDGEFPNHAADPSKYATLKDLQACVQNNNLHCGLAFDGDGDRLGLVDETGAIVTADQTLLLLAKDHLARFPGAPIIFTVSNSSVLETEIRTWGGRPVMCKVGHSHVEHSMREEKAMLGGEQSGHFFSGEGYYAFDDAIVAALRVLAIMKQSQVISHQSQMKPLSALVAEFPHVFQAQELRPACEDALKGSVVLRATKFFQKKYPVVTLDGARIDFGDGAWAGIRYSNTSPVLSICMEARSQEKLSAVSDEVLEHMRTYPEVTMPTYESD